MPLLSYIRVNGSSGKSQDGNAGFDTYYVFGQPLVHFYNIFGNVCHHRNQTLCCVVHVVLQCHILRRFEPSVKKSNQKPIL